MADDLSDDEFAALYMRPLYQELDTASGLVEATWDYGYGGESYERYDIDIPAVMEFIETRERRLLGGMTLEEFVASRTSGDTDA